MSVTTNSYSDFTYFVSSTLGAGHLKPVRDAIKKRLTPSALKSLQNISYEFHLARVRLSNRVNPSKIATRRRLRREDNIKLHWGCGPRHLDGWVNIDGWPTRATDYVHDLRNTLPLQDETVELIFTEHVMEHIEFNIAQRVLADFFRVMKPKGRLRIVVPGLQQCCRAYIEGKKEWFQLVDEPCISAGQGFNRIFYSHFHRFIYDYETLAVILKEAGFSTVNECSHLASVDERLRLDADHESRRLVSLYVEAVK